MILQDFALQEGNYFIAMQYHTLILNRTYLVLITDDFLIALKVNGAISVEGGKDNLTRKVTGTFAVSGDLDNPFSYIKNKYLQPLLKQDVYSSSILAQDKANFRIDKKDIVKVTYDRRKKWGMGYYPHDGRVYIKTNDGKTREFIILGEQSGEAIAEWIMR